MVVVLMGFDPALSTNPAGVTATLVVVLA